MKTLLRGKHFITLEEWDKGEIETLLEVSYELKRLFAAGIPHKYLDSKTVFMIFFEQSTRTRNSIEAGITQLGGHAHDLTPDKLQIAHGESAKDTAMVLSRFGHAIAIRYCDFGIGNKYIREVAKWASVPVISMQDDLYHPLQAIADLMTLQERFGRDLKGLRVTISWAYAKSHAKPLSVPQSQILLFSRFGMDIRLAHPPEFPLLPEFVEKAKLYAEASGGSFEIVDDMDEAFKDAQVVIPKNWGGFAYTQNKEEMSANLEKHRNWICDEGRMSLTAPDSVYMHALPADRGREVVDSVIDGPKSIVYDEAENRLHTAKAVMLLTMGGRP